MTIPIANPLDYEFCGRRTPLFRFGFGTVQVYAWGCRHLEDALEAAAEWCAENAPGVFSEPDEEVCELAEVDHTYTESGYLLSYEWWVDEVIDTTEYGDVYDRSVEEVEAM